MKFIVSRASNRSDKGFVCSEAKRDSIVRVDKQYLRSPEEFDEG